MKKAKGILAIISFVAFTSCVTVNIYFPAAEVQRTAKEITQEVRGKPEKEKSNSSSFKFITPAYAQRELTVSNATIRALKESMKKKYPLLKPYLSAGVLGEALSGYLVMKDISSLGLKERAKVKRLFKKENEERSALYKAVADALNIKKEDIKRVEKIFAKEWQNTAPPGTWIEIKPGKWIKKK